MTEQEAQAVLDDPAGVDAETLLEALAHPSPKLVVADAYDDGMQRATEAAHDHPELARRVPPDRWCAADLDLLDADAVGPVNAVQHRAFTARVHETLWGELASGHAGWLRRSDVVSDTDLPALLDHVHDQLRLPDACLEFLAIERARRGHDAVARRLAHLDLGTLQAVLPELADDLVVPALTHPERLQALSPDGEEVERLYGLVRKHLASDRGRDPEASLALVRFAPHAWWAADLVLALHRVHGEALLSALGELTPVLGSGTCLETAVHQILNPPSPAGATPRDVNP